MAQKKHRAVLLELADHFTRFRPPATTAPLSSWFDFFYGLLSEKYPCEYVYKNAIATGLYLQKNHDLQNSLLTDELRSGASRADVVILNGTSTVYEIKTEYDSFDRLEGQIADYSRVFDRIYIVTPGKRAHAVTASIEQWVGVIRMDDDCNLDVVRHAISNKQNTDPAAIFDCMRQAEFCAVIREVFGEVPDVPNSQIYTEAKSVFCRLSPADAHDQMVSKVRKRGRRRAFADLIGDAPDSLKHACLAFSKSQSAALSIRRRLMEPLQT